MNRRDDVKMVQYMLANYFDAVPPDPETSVERPEGELAIDGICGPATLRWIQAYQKSITRYPINTDGRVDRGKGTGVSTITHKAYTIVSLNMELEEVDPDAWSQIPALFPMTAKAALPPDDPEYPRVIQSTQPRDPGRTRTSPSFG